MKGGSSAPPKGYFDMQGFIKRRCSIARRGQSQGIGSEGGRENLLQRLGSDSCKPFEGSRGQPKATYRHRWTLLIHVTLVVKPNLIVDVGVPFLASAADHYQDGKKTRLGYMHTVYARAFEVQHASHRTWGTPRLHLSRQPIDSACFPYMLHSMRGE